MFRRPPKVNYQIKAETLEATILRIETRIVALKSLAQTHGEYSRGVRDTLNYIEKEITPDLAKHTPRQSSVMERRHGGTTPS